MPHTCKPNARRFARELREGAAAARESKASEDTLATFKAFMEQWARPDPACVRYRNCLLEGTGEPYEIMINLGGREDFDVRLVLRAARENGPLSYDCLPTWEVTCHEHTVSVQLGAAAEWQHFDTRQPEALAAAVALALQGEPMPPPPKRPPRMCR